MTEQEKVLRDFIIAFNSNKNKRIVLYGLGINTEYIIKHCPKSIQIVGLMDAQNEGRTFWGYPVLSADDVMGKADIIVVVARVSVLKVIFERIRLLAEEMMVCTVSGVPLKELFDRDVERYEGDSLWNIVPEDIYKAIDAHPVISFDIFDTLLMRRVLQPEDVFGVVEETLGGTSGFFQKRREAERIANNRTEAPTINEIYEELAHFYGEDANYAEKLKNLEFDTEKENLLPRGDVFCFFEYAKNKGKTIVLLSDMYWPELKIREILSAVGVVGYSDLIVSSEYHRTKEKGGLYSILKERYGNDILHMGDNEIADICMAKKNGIECQRIISARELLLHSPLQKLLVHIKNLADKRLLGTFLSEALNSPFALNDSKGFWMIRDERDLAKWCFAPLMAGMISWMMRELRGKGRNNTVILFTARDGYLFKKIYDDAIAGKEEEFPESIYFYTSRRAISVANIRDREDIHFEARRLHSTEKLGDILIRHFGVEPDAADIMKDTFVTTPKDIKMVDDYLLCYESEILRHAAEERTEYLAYVDSLNFLGKDFYIFDLVCEGSVPRGIEKLLGREGTLLALGTLNIPNRYYSDEVRVLSYLGNQGEYDRGYNAFCYYKLLEMVAAPHEGSLRCFSAGERVLETEIVDRRVFLHLQVMQEVIGDAVNHFLSYCQKDSFTLTVLDDFFGLVSSKYSDTKKIECLFWHEDPSVGEKLYPAWNSIVD